jgi:thioredoxin-dependent peroxiredoxin
MIDPPKATKGRRMSKKTRKKSSKTPAAKAARARPAKSAKKPAAKGARATGKKSGKKSARKPPVRVTPAPSHSAPSKKLKLPVSGDSTPLAKKPGGTTGKPVVAEGAKEGAREGAKAPAFRLPRDGGGTVSLADYSGKKLVLFFYPRADTPGCTKEAIDFTRLADAFAKSQTAVVGISADPPKAQEAFRDKHQLTVPLGSDEQHGMLEAYGVWGEKSMYGRTFHGILRTTVLIGADGRIIRIWRNVRVDGHADEVLAAARVP